MKGYLFDTCVVRKWYGGNAAIRARVEALPGDALIYISAITIGEIEFGHTSVRSDPLRQAEFRKWIKETFEIPLLAVTGQTGWIYAEFRRLLFDRYDRKGKYTENREDKLGAKVNVDENDLWLVAQAKEHDLTLVTSDGMGQIESVVGDRVDIDYWPET